MKNARKKSRRGRQQARRLWGVLGLVGLALLAAWYFWNDKENAGDTVAIEHIHSLGYSGDGSELVVAAHSGLRVYQGGQWSVPPGLARDYMGYTPVDEGFYSSGHPAPGSLEINPLGLVKSTDKGATLTRLGFEGESDFHLMAVGFFNHAIYVVNSSANSRLGPGVHYSLDDGATWEQARLNGIAAAQPYQIAVHPTAEEIVAISTEAGVYLSRDYGNNFELIGEQEPIIAVTFDLQGQWIVFGAQTLRRYDLNSGEIIVLPIPSLSSGEVIQYLASHPDSTMKFALATSDLDIYMTENDGDTWVQIAREGYGLTQ
jgi:hypothetical protein